MAKTNENDLIDVEPEALQAAEFMQAQHMLEGMVGRRILSARVEETRIALETDDGAVYYFYGFMGEDIPEDEDEEAE
jgi:hypothetical protein